MLREAHTIRERGYSLSDEEVDNGVLAIGAPVFDSTGQVVAGLALAGLKFTINEKQLSRMISLSVECARSISLKLGAPLNDSLFSEWKSAAFSPSSE